MQLDGWREVQSRTGEMSLLRTEEGEEGEVSEGREEEIGVPVVDSNSLCLFAKRVGKKTYPLGGHLGPEFRPLNSVPMSLVVLIVVGMILRLRHPAPHPEITIVSDEAGLPDTPQNKECVLQLLKMYTTLS
eukprot:1313542-Rhodomonas_salina.1